MFVVFFDCFKLIENLKEMVFCCLVEFLRKMIVEMGRVLMGNSLISGGLVGMFKLLN